MSVKKRYISENFETSKDASENAEETSQSSGMTSERESAGTSEEDFEKKDMKKSACLTCATLEKFFDACLSGDIDDLKNLVEVVDVNEKAPSGSSGLHMAAQEGHLEIVDWIIENGGDVNILCRRKTTPLHTAAMCGYIKIVETLTKNGADIEAKAEKILPLLWQLLNVGIQKLLCFSSKLVPT